jgi:hypothetical protein
MVTLQSALSAGSNRQSIYARCYEEVSKEEEQRVEPLLNIVNCCLHSYSSRLRTFKPVISRSLNHSPNSKGRKWWQEINIITRVANSPEMLHQIDSRRSHRASPRMQRAPTLNIHQKRVNRERIVLLAARVDGKYFTAK